MSKYLVIPTYDDLSELKDEIFIVEAQTRYEAIMIYGNHYAPHDELMIENLNEKSVNMSFAEKFWIQGHHESDHFMSTGNILIDENQFRQRVKDFFSDHPDFADIYLAYYFSIKESFEWPDEMLAYIFWRDFDERSYHVINLETVPVLTR